MGNLSEKEKLAIEHLKSYRYTCNPITSQHIETLLNLIEKQQKEIEELEDFIKHAQIIVPFENTNIKENEPLADIVEVEHKSYISKDKIREKIEELKSIGKYQLDHKDLYLEQESIDLLEELLGGKE